MRFDELDDVEVEKRWWLRNGWSWLASGELHQRHRMSATAELDCICELIQRQPHDSNDQILPYRATSGKLSAVSS